MVNFEFIQLYNTKYKICLRSFRILYCISRVTCMIDFENHVPCLRNIVNNNLVTFLQNNISKINIHALIFSCNADTRL